MRAKGPESDGRRGTGNRCLRPAYLTEVDYPWLERLIEEVERLAGQRRIDVVRRLKEPMPFDAPKPKLAAAIRQVSRSLREERLDGLRPEQLRTLLFSSAAALRATGLCPPVGSSAYRAAAVADCTMRLDDGDRDVRRLLMQRLYADIPGERIIAGLPESLTPGALATLANAAIVAGHLKRAHEVVTDLLGESRRVIRQAKLRGLLCTTTRTALGVRLAISGPLAIIRRTTYYGRVLAELVPFLSWCPRFAMTATCLGQNGVYQLRVQSGDPLPPAAAKPAYDSQVERLFARDFGKATDQWDLLREPEPIESVSADGLTRLVFPDFAAVQRTDPSRRWLIEIIGFWTPGYLAAKLDGLRDLGRDRLILCVDEQLAQGADGLGEFSRVVRYRKRVKVAEVLAIIDGE